MLDHAETVGRDVTQLSLLKILYFAHGWHLARFNRPLFSNRVEAWSYGPVIRAVYESFREYRHRPIRNRARVFDVSVNAYIISRETFSHELSKFMHIIFEHYSRYDALSLSDLTHETGGPWDVIWKQSQHSPNLGMVIPNDLIREHFQRRLRRRMEH